MSEIEISNTTVSDIFIICMGDEINHEQKRQEGLLLIIRKKTVAVKFWLIFFLPFPT
jgi:hypothetical protein